MKISVFVICDEVIIYLLLCNLHDCTFKNRRCYYFDKMINFEDFNLDNILIDEKLYENTLVYNISYKNLIGAKPLLIRFDKIDGFIRGYDGTRYLVLFGAEKCDFIYNMIRYLIGVESDITYSISQNLAKIKVVLCDSLLLVKTLTLHNAYKLTGSVFNKDKISY